MLLHVITGVLLQSLTAKAQEGTTMEKHSFSTMGYYVLLPVSVIAGIVILIRVACRLTVGNCKCTTSMKGKTVIITGSNTGIGREVAKELAVRGARIILACRNEERGREAEMEIKKETGNQKVTFKKLDLSSFASIKHFADEVNKTEKRLHVLINNAGVICGDNYEETVDGCEMTMQTNYLGLFYLTKLLLDLMKKSAPSRIISLTSSTYSMASINVEKFNYTKHNYNAMKSYYDSKMAVVLFTRELAHFLLGTGVTVNCVDPGVVKTGIGRNNKGIRLLAADVFFFLFSEKIEESAQAVYHVAISPFLNEVSGKCFKNCKEFTPAAFARNRNNSRLLWKTTEKFLAQKISDYKYTEKDA